MKNFVVAILLVSLILLVACAAFTRPDPTPPPPGSPPGTPSVQQPATAEQIASAVAKALEPTPLGPWANIVSLAVTAAVSAYATHKVKDNLAAARSGSGIVAKTP